jgi:hypothetical protein
MKALMKYKFFLLTLVAIIFISSCEVPDSEIEYGFPLIYMPQASVLSGGLNNNYPVPGGNNRYPNYHLDSISGQIDIVLGVYRAGLQKLEEFSVDIYSNIDTINQIISNNIIANAAILPADLYSFPTNVTVTDGNREMIFYLTVDGAKLNSDYPELAGKTLLVAIAIQNPTKYELNHSLSTTIVRINANSFMPLP